MLAWMAKSVQRLRLAGQIFEQKPSSAMVYSIGRMWNVEDILWNIWTFTNSFPQLPFCNCWMRHAEMSFFGLWLFVVFCSKIYEMRDVECRSADFDFYNGHFCIKDAGYRMWDCGITISIFPNPATQVFRIVNFCGMILIHWFDSRCGIFCDCWFLSLFLSMVWSPLRYFLADRWTDQWKTRGSVIVLEMSRSGSRPCPVFQWKVQVLDEIFNSAG